MNKYKEAKQYIDMIWSKPSWSRVDIDWLAIEQIKELVDKETPMKPILREFINKHDCEDYEYLCGKCKDHLAYHRGRVDRCNDNECNQLVDWSGEE